MTVVLQLCFVKVFNYLKTGQNSLKSNYRSGSGSFILPQKELLFKNWLNYENDIKTSSDSSAIPTLS